ncbi:MAG: patatin-like phospholipase family protein [Candidatus Amulumruptor caecigallinarius]|nr:patatin-like phospholipase family protein [Candidatus Amulumruptor caecigallinarius]
MKKIESLISRMGSMHGTTGMAFSGGGARGFSHIGVIMAMERFGIAPDIISGVSAGSIASVLYASGLSPLDMRQCFADANKFADYREWTLPKDGIFKLTKFAKMLEEWLSVSNIEDLNIPTVICATNLERGTQIGWSKGEIVPRVIASCSIPIVFCPIEINGEHYVDGGVLHNIPAWAIRDYCDTLIGCNCSPLNPEYVYRDSLLDIAIRTYQLTVKSNVLLDTRLCDYMITPRKLTRHKIFDMSALDDAIKIGYEAACMVFDNIYS